VRPAAKRACTVALGIDPSHPDHLFEALRTQLRRCENVMKLGKARLLRRSLPWDNTCSGETPHRKRTRG